MSLTVNAIDKKIEELSAARGLPESRKYAAGEIRAEVDPIIAGDVLKNSHSNGFCG